MARDYSIVIPTYNRRDTLLVVLGALERQDAPELLREVVVVDDGSSDGTAQAVAALETPLSINLLTGRRGGPAAARNAGVEAAAGDLVLFLCDDVEPSPGLLSAHDARHDEAGGPHAVVGRVDWPPGKEPSHFEQFAIETYHFGFEALEGLDELPFHAFITANLSIERDLVQELGGFDEGFSYGWEDTDLGLRATRAGVKLLYAPDAVAYHHHEIDPSSYCRRQSAVGCSAVHFMRKHPDLPEVVGAERMPRPWTLRWLAKSALFNRALSRAWLLAARALAAIGAHGAAEGVYCQVLAGYYYRSMARTLEAEDASGNSGRPADG
jgi:GT2 family glycosyltransferase